MILIGSRAAQWHGMNYRDAIDHDFVCTEAEARAHIAQFELTILEATATKITASSRRGIHFEYEIITPGTSSELLAGLVPEGEIPPLDLLFTIKKSHRYKKDSPHFWKTLADYHCMKAMGACVRPEYAAFLKLREAETYTNKLPKLNVKKTEFFQDDNIKYVYDHDKIHEAVALGPKPAYRYFLKEEAEVMTSKAKFFDQSREVQINSVIEESAVLAIERSLVPHPGVMTPLKAWRYALSKVCSSIASGWWREFAYENALEILKRYPEGYWERAQAAGFVPVP